MSISKYLLAAILVALSIAFASADLPVHCLFSEFGGVWRFMKDDAGKSSQEIRGQCGFDAKVTPSSVVRIQLKAPNVAVDLTTGATGVFTAIYDQGMEVIVGDAKYFAFFNYEKHGSTVISRCNETMVGTYHDANTNDNWGCFVGAQESNAANADPITKYDLEKDTLLGEMTQKVFTNDNQFIEAINKAQSSWVAGPAPQFEGKSMDEIFKLSGSSKVNRFKRQRIQAFMDNMKSMRGRRNVQNAEIPESLDWRNISGVDYTTPVRNQGSCGSCWLFGTVEQMADRVKVASKGQTSLVLSPQQLGACSMASPQYGQFCDGGFPYLAAKWAHEFGGVTHEECYPYLARDTQCNAVSCSKPNVQVTDYKYVGGYFGASDEQNMMQDIAEHGPQSVAIMVYPDFFHYKSGVYRHVKNVHQEMQNGWEEVNHAVLCIGFGSTPEGTPYWIVKNSWGKEWGQNGYVLIYRGADEIAIESCPMSLIPSYQE